MNIVHSKLTLTNAKTKIVAHDAYFINLLLHLFNLKYSITAT